MMSRYLLEIGVEEIPSDYIQTTKNQLKEKFQKLVDENKLTVDEIRVESTPRRFAVFLENINASNSDSLISVKGPSAAIAYDENGNPNKPLLGFLKGQGAEVSDVVIKDYNGSDYVYIEKKEESKSVAQVLKENVYDLVKSINFKRSMRWGGKSIRWARPIRYFVSILDDKILEFDAEGITVSNVTRGHRTLGEDKIVIDSIDNYEKLLRDNYVILSYKDRRDTIIRGLNKINMEKGGEYMHDEDLLDEVINIVEYPTVLAGDIDTKYLELPKEVIITPMKDHQRYFPVLDENENLLPYFLLVRNGDDNHGENVVLGNKKVLVARLEDAKFFYEIDTAKDLEEYVEELRNLTFFEGLGSMYQKTQRLVDLSAKYQQELNLGEDIKEDLKRAAYLSKADLVTKMVIEFTELQGTMGKIYALNSKENERVANAIEEQYMPTSAGGDLPKTITGIVLSIADKIDSIVGLYAIGKYVTGSQDPFGLRRQALGLINIILENNIDVDLKDLINDSLIVYTEENELPFDYDQTMAKTIEFIKDRLKNMLIDDEFRYDIVNSVINSEQSNILRIYQRVKATSEFVEENEDALSYFNRINNLAKENNLTEIDSNLLENELENKFYEQITSIENRAFQSSEDYKQELKNVADTAIVGNDYLDNTMINVEDEAVKNNRLAMLNNLSQRIKKVFDINQIVK
ncbi:MAG: glycine--tRNA ligase subunit beta [Anaerococcus sp.]|uniref:glycine--tRNA ligase subunit beta n=1 Tax=Anaerococcus sp. TaxID=1872515 RepID=UPI00291034D2|nr:glycine--tRNA ligase subunit beta [Anaerococcus sp.]MDU7411108.1 glycine--tRNA ligase subunit beta [Anaerococcus sp.]